MNGGLLMLGMTAATAGVWEVEADPRQLAMLGTSRAQEPGRSVVMARGAHLTSDGDVDSLSTAPCYSILEPSRRRS